MNINVTPELLLAIGSFAGVLFGLARQWSEANKLARRDELKRLEGKVWKLDRRLQSEMEYRIKLQEYIGVLIRKMREAGLEVPPMPEMPDLDNVVESEAGQP